MYGGGEKEEEEEKQSLAGAKIYSLKAGEIKTGFGPTIVLTVMYNYVVKFLTTANARNTPSFPSKRTF